MIKVILVLLSVALNLGSVFAAERGSTFTSTCTVARSVTFLYANANPSPVLEIIPANKIPPAPGSTRVIYTHSFDIIGDGNGSHFTDGADFTGTATLTAAIGNDGRIQSLSILVTDSKGVVMEGITKGPKFIEVNSSCAGTVDMRR